MVCVDSGAAAKLPSLAVCYPQHTHYHSHSSSDMPLGSPFPFVRNTATLFFVEWCNE
eukprot:m.430030 g.430030  ORF g.430030 m.430030 type:complete len:57 (-) comp77288_c0_seq1:39-209(-)